jgi:hypothetical protein
MGKFPDLINNTISGATEYMHIVDEPLILHYEDVIYTSSHGSERQNDR